MAERFKTPVLISDSQTANFISKVVTYLSTALAPMVTRTACSLIYTAKEF